MKSFVFISKIAVSSTNAIFSFGILTFLLIGCSVSPFENLPTRNTVQNPLRLTFQFAFPTTFQAVYFKPVQFLWPNGKNEKVWKTQDVFSNANQFDLKNLIEKGLDTAFGNIVFESNGKGNIFAISPINILVAEEEAIVGEFAFYFRTEGGAVCKERLSLFLKKETSNETLKWALSKGVAYQSIYFANRCLDPSFVSPKEAIVSYSLFERPWEFLKTKVTGSYEPFTVSFLESIDGAIERLPKEMKYQECVQYGNTASGGVRCIYSEVRTVRDIDWKGHTRDEKEFRWDWALPEKKEPLSNP